MQFDSNLFAGYNQEYGGHVRHGRHVQGHRSQAGHQEAYCPEQQGADETKRLETKIWQF